MTRGGWDVRDWGQTSKKMASEPVLQREGQGARRPGKAGALPDLQGNLVLNLVFTLFQAQCSSTWSSTLLSPTPPHMPPGARLCPGAKPLALSWARQKAHGLSWRKVWGKRSAGGAMANRRVAVTAFAFLFTRQTQQQ